jgi:hypothetical protein
MIGEPGIGAVSHNATNEQGFTMSTPRPTTRKPYRLIPEGLASFRAAAARTRPWERSTGPRSTEGKARSNRNAWKHGERAADTIRTRRLVAALLTKIDTHEPERNALFNETGSGVQPRVSPGSRCPVEPMEVSDPMRDASNLNESEYRLDSALQVAFENFTY